MNHAGFMDGGLWEVGEREGGEMGGSPIEREDESLYTTMNHGTDSQMNHGDFPHRRPFTLLEHQAYVQESFLERF